MGVSSRPKSVVSAPQGTVAKAANAAVTDRIGLTWAGLTRFAQHYGDTLAEWHRNFDAAWSDLTPLGFDERFRKLWKFYLSYCEAGFRTERTNVVQLSLAKG